MPSTKDVKWGQELLVAVHLGQRPTAGYSVLVRKLERRTSNTTTVCYDERKPAPNSSAGSVTTSPYEIIRVERAAGNFEFERSEGRQSGGVVTSDFLSWRVYEEGRTCGVTREGTYVIRNQDEFEVYWRSLNAEDVAPRDVDWSKENLIAIHLGSKATGGYEILPREVVPLNDGRLYCSFLERLPSRDQHVSKTKTSPYCILRVAKFLGAVLFDHRTWDNTGTG